MIPGFSQSLVSVSITVGIGICKMSTRTLARTSANSLSNLLMPFDPLIKEVEKGDHIFRGWIQEATASGETNSRLLGAKETQQ